MSKKFKWPAGIRSQAVIVVTELDNGRLSVVSRNDGKSLASQWADALINVAKAAGKQSTKRMGRSK